MHVRTWSRAWVARFLFHVLFCCHHGFCSYARHAFSTAPKTQSLIKHFTSQLYTLFFTLPWCFIRVFLLRSLLDERDCLDVWLFSHRVLIALGLFRRKLPIKHVNSDVCVYSDLIFSSSGQWSRNALMQIVAIAPWCGGLPRRDYYTRFNHLALSLYISLFLFAYSIPRISLLL